MWQQQQRPGFLPPDAGPEWLQAAYYQNIPHGEVNWAQLAQQWIVMRQLEEQQNVQRQLQMMQQQQLQQQLQEQQFLQSRLNSQNMGHMIQPPLPPMPPPDMAPIPPPLHATPQFQFQGGRPPLYQQAPPLYGAGVGEPNVLFPSGRMSEGRFPQPSPAAPVVPQSPSFRPPRYNNNPPIAQQFPSAGQQPTASSAPSLLTSDFQPPPGYVPSDSMVVEDVDLRTMWPGGMARDDNNSSSPDSSMIDIQMRKQLPAWIREGLEKMEREKLKQQQAEKEEQERMSGSGASGGNRIPKWRLEETASDAEQNQSESDLETRSRRKHRDASGESGTEGADRRGAPKSDSESEGDDSDAETAEEIKEKLMVKLRYWMTSILMEVTSAEINNVVRTFYKASRATAQPKVLAQSSALASILGFADEDERDDGSSTSDAEAGEESTNNRAPNEDHFKVPMLPSPVSVSKKKAADGILSSESALVKSTPKESADNRDQSSRLSNPDSSEPSHASESGKEERKSSSRRRGRSRSKERERRRHRSRSRSRSRSKGRSRSRSRSRERRRHRHRSRDRSRSPSSRNGEKRRSSKREEKSSRSRSKSPLEEKERRKHKKRSRSPRKHRY